MAAINTIDHNSGPPVSAHWTLFQSGVGHSITVASAMNGTAEGLEIDDDTTAGFTLRKAHTAPATGGLRLRVFLDPNGLTRPDSSTYIFFSISVSNSSADLAIALDFRVNSAGNQYEVLARTSDDANNSQDTALYNFTDAPHCFEGAFFQSSATSTPDGSIELYIDGVLKETKSGLAIFDDYDAGVNWVVGTAGAPTAGVSGQFYVDEVVLDDSSSAVLCLAAFTPTLAPMTKPVDIDADGSNLYLALLNNSNPILIKMSTALNADGSTVFAPGAGDDIGIQCGRFDADVVWVAGAFDGTNVVEKSEDGGTTFTVKDPATFGDVEAFVVGPDSDTRVLVADDNVNVQQTIDDGDTWTAINTGTGFNVNAIARLPQNVQESVFGNDSGATDNVNFSVNSGADMEDFSTGFPTQDATRVIVN